MSRVDLQRKAQELCHRLATGTKAKPRKHPMYGTRKPSGRSFGRWTNPSHLRAQGKPPKPSHRVH
jgi:hypothetical protein